MATYLMTYQYFWLGRMLTTFDYFDAENITEAKQRASEDLKLSDVFDNKSRKLLWIEEDRQ